jgi:hypothetical protein
VNDRRRVWIRRLPWLVLAIPGLAQLWLLWATVLARYGYPYDLEWMEGGLLTHAQRIADGVGIYVEPSVYFIPYLYTPLYPGLLAAFGSLFGLSYQLGRAVSMLAILGLLALFAVAILYDARRRPREDRLGLDTTGPALCGVAVAAGFFAATYPWVEGWYDLVRADTLFLAMIVGGLVGLRVWARAGTGWTGHLRVAAAAAILGLSFFCKQTGVLYVAAGGVLLLIMNWRRLPIYVLTSGVIGLGGTWILNRTSSGWFWTYAYEVHQVHDFNMDRFYQSFGNILWHFPAMTAVIAAALVVVGITAATRRRLPRASKGLLYWTFVFAVSCLVGALGWGTQWAHFNAYIPAMTTGAIATGAALPALTGALSVWLRRPWAEILAMGAAAALGWQLLSAWWQPARFVPSEADRDAGDALVEYIRGIEGEILIPYHPWYGQLADKRTYVHRMGILDVTYANGWQVAGLREALTEARFGAIILDGSGPRWELPGLQRGYRLDDHLPASLAPRVVTGARTAPQEVWKPARREPIPKGVRVLFDFEDGSYRGWTVEGTAWGQRPVTAPVQDQGPVRRYGGRFFATSMHGGDSARGVMTSPEFRLDGKRLTFRIGGGADADNLRVELHVGDAIVRAATAEVNSERMYDVDWSLDEFQGERARLVLTDASTGSWGHLNVDEFWLWDE